VPAFPAAAQFPANVFVDWVLCVDETLEVEGIGLIAADVMRLRLRSFYLTYASALLIVCNSPAMATRPIYRASIMRLVE
jgi:uncharacterized membrane protein